MLDVPFRPLQVESTDFRSVLGLVDRGVAHDVLQDRGRVVGVVVVVVRRENVVLVVVVVVATIRARRARPLRRGRRRADDLLEDALRLALLPLRELPARRQLALRRRARAGAAVLRRRRRRRRRSRHPTLLPPSSAGERDAFFRVRRRDFALALVVGEQGDDRLRRRAWRARVAPRALLRGRHPRRPPPSTPSARPMNAREPYLPLA